MLMQRRARAVPHRPSAHRLKTAPTAALRRRGVVKDSNLPNAQEISGTAAMIHYDRDVL
jgi:hypothetical protein